MAAVKFEVYMGSDSQYRFKFFGRDGKQVAISRGFQHKDGCMEGIREVKENAGASENYQKKVIGEKPAFVLRMPNRKVVLEAGPYATPEECASAMADVRVSGQAVIIEK